MAIKIRCSECKKKISVDEAFSGGVCRCPYCTALVFVASEGAGALPSGRPDAPGGRPAAPGGVGRGSVQQARVAVETAQQQDAPDVPVATPVRLQGIVALIMLAAMLILLCGGGYVVFDAMSKDGGGGSSTQPIGGGGTNGGNTGNGGKREFNPLTDTGVLSGPGIDKMAIGAPIIYCIAGGSSMTETRDYAVLMTYVSVQALSPSHMFNVVMGEEGGADDSSWYRFILDDYISGGPAGKEAIAKPLSTTSGVGAPSVRRLLTAAMAVKPKPNTIVFFANKHIDDAEEIGKLAKEKGIKIVTICMKKEQGIVDDMAKLAAASGGTSMSHSDTELQKWARSANVRPSGE